jgi:hypothetical protein
MKSRGPDGRFRNHNQPVVLAQHTVRSRWIESEVLKLKRLGFTYEKIAEQITAIGQGQAAPLAPLPDDVSFPPDYKITPMGCHKALTRALRRAPRLETDELRRIDTDRCEDMYLYLSPAIKQGDPQAVRAAVQALALKATINGYKSSEMELKVSPRPEWSSILSKEERMDLYKGAMALLVERGIRVEEMARATGLEVPAIEVKATKKEENDT